MIGLIYARAANGAIGLGGKLPWHLPEDLQRFKELTLGCTVVMGRKTWEGLPDSVKPLPGRQNVVITRHAPSITVGNPLMLKNLDGLRFADQRWPEHFTWIIGGAKVLRWCLANGIGDRIELTQIHREFPGDAFLPAPFGALWVEVAREDGTGTNGIPYSFISYERKKS